MSTVTPARHFVVPIRELRRRLEWCHEDEAGRISQLDIGKFPASTSAALGCLEKLASDKKFVFHKWLHRSNRSDIALVDHVTHGIVVLKIVSLLRAYRSWYSFHQHKDSDLFQKEKAAYSHLKHFGVDSCVLACYGWATITPKCFASEKEPTCFGQEIPSMKDQRKYHHDHHLPTPVTSQNSALYLWNTPGDKNMAEMDIDFRPPSENESWYSIVENDPSDSDTQLSGEDLNLSREALLLEYLPNGRRFQSPILTEELAMSALNALQHIQKALVYHGDHTQMISRNILVTKGRVVFIDFDHAMVFKSVKDPSRTMLLLKQDMLQFRQIVWDWMVRMIVS